MIGGLPTLALPCPGPQDKDGRVSLQDFISYYEKIAHYQSQMAREGRIKSMANLNKQMVPQGAVLRSPETRARSRRAAAVDERVVRTAGGVPIR